MNKKPDEDALFKSLLDGLVKCGALVDDSPDYLARLPVVYQRARDKGIILELTDLDQEAA